jgi:hypothetical protein
MKCFCPRCGIIKEIEDQALAPLLNQRHPRVLVQCFKCGMRHEYSLRGSESPEESEPIVLTADPEHAQYPIFQTRNNPFK